MKLSNVISQIKTKLKKPILTPVRELCIVVVLCLALFKIIFTDILTYPDIDTDSYTYKHTCIRKGYSEVEKSYLYYCDTGWWWEWEIEVPK